MKKTLSIAVVCSALFCALPFASAVTVYTNDWGSPNPAVTGDGNINLVGWTGIARSQTAGPYLGIYQETGPNDPYLGLGLPANTAYFSTLVGTNQPDGPGMFYTTAESGAGSGGHSPFPVAGINPASYTNLTFNVEVNGADTVTNYFAVRVGATQWYVSTQQLSASGGGGNVFTNATMVYTTNAASWKLLTLNATYVTIGATPGADLVGNITGIGIVQLNDTNATGFPGWNYNRIVINQGPNDFPKNPPVNSAAARTPQTVFVGGGASFLTTFAGNPTLVYRWQTNGLDLNEGDRIFGAASNRLTITNINANDALPTYSVYVTNFFGKATNGGITMVVNAKGPDLLYSELFPYVGPSGDLPIQGGTGVGWQVAAPANGSTRGIFSPGGGSGIVYSYSPVATTNAYFTTTTNDIGVSGLPFVAFNPASYPAITLQGQFAPGNGAGTVRANITLYWAVQMDGTWYSSVIPIGTSLVQNSYLTNQLAFQAAATNWNNLTIDGNAVTIGSVAGSDLTGNMTGAGLVFVHNNTSGASMNFDTFEIVTNAVSILPPTITADGVPWPQTVASGGGVRFGVSASGTQPLNYSWKLNGIRLTNGAMGGRIFGATTPTVTIANLTTNDTGNALLGVTITANVTNNAGVGVSSDGIVGPDPSLTVTNPSVGLLYEESFPFVGPLAGNNDPLGNAGWVAAVAGTPDATPNGIYQVIGSDGAAFAYRSIADTTAYYTTTASDTNQAGLRFPNINPAFYTNLNISVDIAPQNSAINVTAYLAVRMSTNWYVAATALPVPTTDNPDVFSTYNTAFNPAAANWKNLTITGTGAIIGSPAAGNLSGMMTGAGLVFVTVGAGGSHNFDNIAITGNGVGGINLGLLTSTNINLSWIGNPAVNLQSSTNLPGWQDVSNSFGIYSLPVPVTGPQKFFRLKGP